MQCASDDLRGLFPHTRDKIYLDHASIGPLSTRTHTLLLQHIVARSEGTVNTFVKDIAQMRETREKVARLINAESPDRIAFFMNTSDALNIIPAGLEWRTGDIVLLNDLEFPSNVYPYLNLKRHGVEIEFLRTREGEVTPEMVEQAITRSRREDGSSKVKLVSLSAVQFLSGFRADIAAIGALCKQYGVIFVVDAIQAAGAVPIDVQAMYIDALACGAQKWLMSTTGLAFLYITEELQERVEQATLGWISVEKPWDFFKYDQALNATATRYENGTLNFPGIIALGASLQTILEVKVSRIEEHLGVLTEQLIVGLRENSAFSHVTDFPKERRAGIVSATLANPSNGEEILAAMLKANCIVSLREGRLRFAPHCYNTSEEIARTLDVVRDVCK